MLVDDREARTNRYVVETLEKALDDVEVKRLTFGDYAFFGTPVGETIPYIGIETCTVNDLVGKIQSGRFQQQLVGCLSHYDVTVLLIEGHVREDADSTIQTFGHRSKMPFVAIHSALLAAKAHGIIVEETIRLGKGLVAERLLALYGYYTKKTHTLFRSAERESLTLSPQKAIERPVLALMQITQGVGEEKARAALTYFGSLEKLLNADDSDLLHIPGWGPVLVKNFHRTLEHDFRGVTLEA